MRASNPLRTSLSDRFGAGATATWEASTSLGDRHELRTLAEDAGFTDCHVRYDVKIGRHQDPEKFIMGVISTTPLSEAFADLASKDRKTLIRSILTQLYNFTDDGGLAYPGECHTLTARR